MTISNRLREPILPDMIPASSWGSSLANLLTRPSWDAIRFPVISARGNRCQVCSEQKRAMECHEIWAYSMPPRSALEGTIGVQRLIGLAALCSECHEMFHLGFAKIRGRLEAVSKRLMAVNGWTDAQYKSFYRTMGSKFTTRSEVYWGLDLSLVGDGQPLVVKDEWTLDADGMLTRPARGAPLPSQTVLFGASYVVDGRTIPALDPSEALDGLLPEEADFAFVRQMGTGVFDDLGEKPLRRLDAMV